MTEKLKAALREGNECYLKVMDQKFFSKILGVADDTVWVSFPGADYPTEGMGVDVEFHDFEGFLCYHTRVVIGPKQTGDGIILQRSEAATYMRHRRSWRVSTDLPGEMGRGESKAAVRVVDLSADGAQIDSPKPFDVGTGLHFTFSLPEKPPCTVSCRIIRCSDGKVSGSWIVALLFTDVPDSVRPSLTWFLYKRIRKEHAQELADMYPRSKRPAKKRRWIRTKSKD